MIAAYYRRLTGEDEAVQLAAARAWACGKARRCRCCPIPAAWRRSVSRDTRSPLRGSSATISRTTDSSSPTASSSPTPAACRDIDGVIVHGRYDLCTPISMAWALHKAWPRAEYRVVDDSGHAMTEPGIIDELVTRHRGFKSRDL